MKKAILSASIATLALGAIAGPKPPSKTPTSLKCPVTGGVVNIAAATKAHMYTDYKGRRYFFCCDGCPQNFKKNPAKYANPKDSIPTPKAKKK